MSKSNLMTVLAREIGVVACASLVGAIAAAWVVTNGRTDAFSWSPCIAAWLACQMCMVPGSILRNLMRDESLRHIVAVAWRLPCALFGVATMVWWSGLERKCFLAALVTCYFISLTLESGLQIRQAKRTPKK